MAKHLWSVEVLTPCNVNMKIYKFDTSSTPIAPYDKICNTIIDGGSCKNYVDKKMIDKLKHKRKPH